MSYGRYWEGRSQLQILTSKLTDAVVMCLCFDRETVCKDHPTQQQIKEHHHFRDTLLHVASLLHGVALATLRTDFDFDNLIVRSLPVYRHFNTVKWYNIAFCTTHWLVMQRSACF